MSNSEIAMAVVEQQQQPEQSSPPHDAPLDTSCISDDAVIQDVTNLSNAIKQGRAVRIEFRDGYTLYDDNNNETRIHNTAFIVHYHTHAEAAQSINCRFEDIIDVLELVRDFRLRRHPPPDTFWSPLRNDAQPDPEEESNYSWRFAVPYDYIPQYDFANKRVYVRPCLDLDARDCAAEVKLDRLQAELEQQADTKGLLECHSKLGDARLMRYLVYGGLNKPFSATQRRLMLSILKE